MNSLEDLLEDDYKKTNHDTITKSVVDRLITSQLYDIIKHSCRYTNHYRMEDGEVDIIARAGKRYFNFEVKSSSRHLNKAYSQLERDERLIKDCITRDCKVYNFVVYGHRGRIIYKRV